MKKAKIKMLLCFLLSITLISTHVCFIRAEDTVPKQYQSTTTSENVQSIQEGMQSFYLALQNHSEILSFTFSDSFDYEEYWNQLCSLLDKHTRNYQDFNVSMLNIHINDHLATIKIGYYTTIEQEQRLDLFDSQLRAKMTGLSDFNKVKYVHDYLCNNVDYDMDTYDEIANERSAYSAMVNGKTVCSGYALAFQRIMEEENIPSRIICGYTPEGPHAWNIVYLDGGWYHIDTTWDDQSWGIDREHFLIGYDSLSFQYQYQDMEMELAKTSYQY